MLKIVEYNEKYLEQISKIIIFVNLIDNSVVNTTGIDKS